MGTPIARSHTSLPGTVLLAVLATACAPEDEGLTGVPPAQWFGEYIQVGAEVDVLPCGNTVEWYDRYIEHVFEVMEEPIPDGFSVSMSYVNDPSEHCGTERAGGCAILKYDHAIIGDSSAAEHELVHLIVNRTLGVAPPLFQEGIATALGGVGAITPDPATPFKPYSMLGPDPYSVSYPSAGRFVWYLVENHGWATFKAFYREAESYMEGHASDDLFERHYGIDLGEAAQRLDAEEPEACSFVVPACEDALLVPWGDDGWSAPASNSCEDSDVIGLNSSDGRESLTRRHVAVEFPTQASHRITTEISIVLHQCGIDRCAERERHYVDSSFPNNLVLPAGRYVVDMVLGHHVSADPVVRIN